MNQELANKVAAIKDEDVPRDLIYFCKKLLAKTMTPDELVEELEILGDSQELTKEAYNNVWDSLITAMRNLVFLSDEKRGLSKVLSMALDYERSGNDFYMVDSGGYSLKCDRTGDELDDLLEGDDKP